MKKYRVQLSEGEGQSLKTMVSSGKSSARAIRRAHILLKSDEGWTDEAIGRAMDVSVQMVEDVRKASVKEGVEKAVQRTSGRKAGTVPRSLDGGGRSTLDRLGV